MSLYLPHSMNSCWPSWLCIWTGSEQSWSQRHMLGPGRAKSATQRQRQWARPGKSGFQKVQAQSSLINPVNFYLCSCLSISHTRPSFCLRMSQNASCLLSASCCNFLNATINLWYHSSFFLLLNDFIKIKIPRTEILGQGHKYLFGACCELQNCFPQLALHSGATVGC